jgi:hypothetical protein
MGRYVMPLYPDAERRKQDLERTCEIFRKNSFIETSYLIGELITIFDRDKLPEDINSKFLSLLDKFEEEFVNVFPTGKDFREKCIRNISSITFNGICKLGREKFSKCLNDLHPLLERLEESNVKVQKISSIIQKIPDNETKFYIYSLLFLFMLEGVFDQIVRVLYFLYMNTDGSRLVFEDIEELEIKEMKKGFNERGLDPIFLSNWESRYRHIRNSIAHLRFSYDNSTGIVHFQDYYPKDRCLVYDQKMPVLTFVETALEVESTIMGLAYLFMLLRINDLLFVSKAY